MNNLKRSKSDLSITQLVDSFKANKSEAVFEELYNRYRNMVFDYIHKFVYNMPQDIVNELMNEVFISVYINLPKLKDPRAFAAWLVKITRNKCINYMKSDKYPYISLDQQTSDEGELIEKIKDNKINIEEKYIQAEIKEAALEELSKLNSKIKEIIILKCINNFTYDEVSQITGVPVRTLKRKIKKNLLKLRDILIRRGFC